MPSLFSSLLVVHIVAGSIALIAGTIAAIAKKGSVLHKNVGLVFYWAMLATASTALVVSQLPTHQNWMLFGVGGFTAQMTLTGRRVVQARKTGSTWFDYAVLAFGSAFAVYMAFIGIRSLLAGNSFGIVSCVFSAVSFLYVWLDIRWLFFVAIKNVWLGNHITRMVGALIASYTAFLVVNIQVDYPFNLAVWLAPTLVGSVFIARMRAKFASKKHLTK
ncbi:MAG: hypothetical protein EAZ47_10735 [Bacteroidetes bacterium]|nr:MAG: hypothetical protein EAY72_07075 [Bacteroidota bacterium]TAE72766.1 MAG: hypothetical protein EAY68_00370 [Bacteroidota bacterium]TAF90804.1 MAG: hypothetical protein EAZ47_10735 [Bacteroidota bacterium]